MPRAQEELSRMVENLVTQPHETPWLEFKRDNNDPEMIGRSISAIANSARLAERQTGYLVWGVEDSSHDIVGTAFDPAAAKKGNEGLINWLARVLSPAPHFEFFLVTHGEVNVVLLEIEAAERQPVAFQDRAYIRIGEHTKEVRAVPAVETALWRVLLRSRFEADPAMEGVPGARVLDLLDHEGYCRLLQVPADRTTELMLETLRSDGLITSHDSGDWTITNLGALLFARDLRAFPRLSRKAPRFIRYDGNSRVASAHEVHFNAGYAIAFENLMAEISRQTPVNEVIGQALRQDVPLYPPLAIREIVANALVHQDLALSGNGPTIEIFTDRVEVTNPGMPLVEPLRFVDAAPRSRNEALASLLRRIGVCEERGSGWDKIAFQVELFQLPAPRLDASDSALRVSLYAPKPLNAMTPDERIHAVYLHACLRYVMAQPTTNSSVRERFSISQANSAQASRLLKEAVASSLVRLRSDTASKRLTAYLPFWA